MICDAFYCSACGKHLTAAEIIDQWPVRHCRTCGHSVTVVHEVSQPPARSSWVNWAGQWEILIAAAARDEEAPY
jgi:hypothetical protein